MLTKDIYNIGKKYNDSTKYNIEYDRESIYNYTIAIFIINLLNSQYELTQQQISKLNAILNNLIVL